MVVPGTLLCYGQLDYAWVWKLQQQFVGARIIGERLDTLILLEHAPVFTIGRSGRDAHWGGSEEELHKTGYPVYRIERGGSITYHGPGQIVGYPIVRLRSFCSGPKGFMRMLEEVIIRTLAVWGILGVRIENLTGVWVGEKKIAAMGVRIEKGVTMHGFSLNVNVDLEPFAKIIPCGIEGCRVTSMAALLGCHIDILAVRTCIAATFAEVFGIRWTNAQGTELQDLPPTALAVERV